MVRKSEVVSEEKKGLDIGALVALAKGRFSKDKKLAGLTDSMKTGSEIVVSTDPDDYIVSLGLSFWKPLTGIMGIPFGRIVQIAGRPDSGKSTAAMLFMEAAQKQNVLVILWDAEGKFDSTRFKDRMGGDPSKLPVVSSRNIIIGARQVVAYVKAAREMDPNQKILIVWDSVGASINSAEDEENDDYSKQPGVTAKEVSWAVRRFNQLIESSRNLETGKYNIATLCINQVYANIGSVGTKQKGGGEIEYLSSLILELSRKQTLTKTRAGQKIKYGITSRAKVAKNHLFGGEDCIAELDVVVNASGIELAQAVKSKETDVDWNEDE